MSRNQSWIVCESSGYWSAALRAALARRQASSVVRVPQPRIREVRSLADLETGSRGIQSGLGFVEVTERNLAAVLELFVKNSARNVRFIALLEGSLGRKKGTDGSQTRIRQSVSDSLSEAGALAVISAPRHIGAVLEIAFRYNTLRASLSADPASAISIADRAWASLPWQDG